MKKILSLVLAAMMLLGCMSLTAFAADNNTTEITATVANSLTYDMVIPTAVSMTEAGVQEIGTPSVENVKHATANTVISYTASGTQLALDGGTATMVTSYYTDSTGTTPMPSTAIEVYKSKALVDPLTTLYVSVAQEAWDAAENGTYKATVTFNFTSEEEKATCEVDTDEYTSMYRVVKIDDGNVYVTMYDKEDTGFGAFYLMCLGLPEDNVEAFLGTEYAVGDCFHVLEDDSVEKCIAPETHGLINEGNTFTAELASTDNPAVVYFVIAGTTYAVNDGVLSVHYGDQSHDLTGRRCSWTLNNNLLSDGATGPISEGDAFVGTDLSD